MEQRVERFATVSDLVCALVRAPEVRDEEIEGRRLTPGDRLGRFELVREIGRGGHGVVFEARDLELGRLVALKSLRRTSREADSAREEALHREARAVASLHHPNIVTLYDYGWSAAGPYLVLELLHGESLSERLSRGPMEPAEVVRIAIDVARALVHAHERGILHRDLKPSNVLLGPGGEVTVLDFGIAGVFGRGCGGGTPGHMAPEQLEGRPEDARTDVYALGVLVAQMVTGTPPRPSQRSDALDRVRKLESRGVPPRLASLVARSLARDPEGRPDSLAFLEGLEVIARGLRIVRSARQATRRFGWFAALALLGTGETWQGASLVIDPPAQRPAQTATASGQTGWAQLGLPVPEEVTFRGEGVTLRGWLFRHPDPAGCGVVFHHDKDSDRRGMLRTAAGFLPRGCDLLLYDSRGHGASDRAKVTFGHHEKLDMLAAVNLLVERSGLPRERIGLFGSSLGASVVLQAAVLAPDLAFVVADSSFADFREMARRDASRGVPFLRPLSSVSVTVAGWRGGFDPDSVSPVNEAGLIRVPVLLLHARRDPRIPWEDSRRIYDRLTTPRRELRVLDWATGHGTAQQDDPPRYSRVVNSFLEENVPGFGRSAG